MTIKSYTSDRFTGLSTDTKPTNVPEGALFVETDTQNMFILVGGAWLIIQMNKSIVPGVTLYYGTMSLAYRNILENSTLSVTTENSSFPKTRLYDRDIGKFFKGTGFASPFAIGIDQGAVTSYEVDRLIIPVGHNLNGLACDLRYSTDNFSSDDHSAVAWTQGDALIIDKSFTALTKRYWKLDITAPATIVQMPELFLSEDVTFFDNPAFGSMVGTKKNVIYDQTQAGLSRKIKLGEIKKHRKFDFLTLPSSQKIDFENWDTLCEGAKSFYLHDYDGTCWFAELIADLEFIAKAPGLWTTNLELLEVLG